MESSLSTMISVVQLSSLIEQQKSPAYDRTRKAAVGFRDFASDVHDDRPPMIPREVSQFERGRCSTCSEAFWRGRASLSYAELSSPSSEGGPTLSPSLFGALKLARSGKSAEVGRLTSRARRQLRQVGVFRLRRSRFGERGQNDGTRLRERRELLMRETSVASSS